MKKENQVPLLSIIVPAYKAQDFIVASLSRIDKVVGELAASYEIICVVDGKVDAAYDLVSNLAEKSKTIKVVGYSKNRGKGYAVRYGFKKARADMIGFIDAGPEIDPISLKELIYTFKVKKADIVVGSKRHPKSKVSYPAFRRVISNIYFFLVKFLFNPQVSDTQAGVKIFKKKVINKIMPKLKVNGFAFDIEMLIQARNSGFNEIYEAPIYVKMANFEKSSTIDSWNKLLFASMRMFYDTLSLFIRLGR